MIRVIRKLLSLPYLWLGQLAAMLGSSMGAELLKLAWAVSGDGDSARLALMQVQKHSGLEVAQALAAAWMEHRPRPEIAGWAGVLAMHRRDAGLVRECLDRGRALGDDRSGMFELLELWLAAEEGTGEEFEQLLARLEARRDLSPIVRKQVLENRLWQTMLEGRLDEAAARAARLLEIEACPPASVALWALARKAGRAVEASRHLRATEALPVDQRLYYQSLANMSVGAVAEAEADVAELEGRSPAMAKRVREVLAGKGRRA